MNKWFYSATCKGLLLILAHLCIVVSVVSFVWVGTSAGLRYLIPFEKVQSHYESTAQFENRMKTMSREVLDQLDTKAKFETNGSYNPDKLIDVVRYDNGSLDQDGTNHSGIAYRLKDLEQWSRGYQNAAADQESWDQFLHDYVTTVIVCLKEDGSYHYYYGDDFRNKMSAGELVFASNGEFVSNEEKLSALLEDDYNTAGYGEVLDQNGQKLYADCWNLGLGEEVLKEPYSLDGAANLVELANTDERWNGKLADAYHALSNTLAAISGDIQNYKEAPGGWEEGNTNYSYIYVDYDENEIYSNRQEFQDIKEIDHYQEKIKQAGAYVIVTPKLAGFESTFENPAQSAQEWKSDIVESHRIIGRNTNYVFMASVDTTYSVPDEFESDREYYQEIVPYITIACEAAWGTLILFFILLVCLTVISGHSNRSENGEIALSGFDRWKTEMASAFVIIFWIMSMYLISEWGSQYVMAYDYYYSSDIWREDGLPIYTMVMAGTIAFVSCLFFFWFYLSMVRRIKAHTLWKNSIMKAVCEIFRHGWRNKKTTTKIVVVYIAFLLVELITWGNTPLMVIGIVVNIGVGVFLVRYALARQKIKKGLLEIAKGNVNYKIPLDDLRGETLEIAQTINRLGEGLNRALEKSVRDERLKTDLITNVSHDIKTPLTSIINYVDILKRENFQDPKIQNYLNILEMKAQRLKTLTEDVVEASKVSSGNIKLEFMTLNLVELIYQVEGEYEEKFEARNIKVILNMPDEPVTVRVDGRRMWRVFANIFNNAAKYAMEGSRVYADLMLQPGTAKFILKNVSDQQLNISADELTERFIRGDVSRSTEGSGLGLSIAKNLTELQGGTFELYLDGDLFKVIITFPRVRRLIKEQTPKKEDKKTEPETKPEETDKK